MPNLYKNGPLAIIPAGETFVAGYTQRLLPAGYFGVGTASYSSQRVLTTYQSTVVMVGINNYWLQALSDAAPREENRMTKPFQAYHVYTVTVSSPDGDIPFKKGDVFFPNSSCVGLTANTAHPIAGAQPQGPNVYELILQRPL